MSGSRWARMLEGRVLAGRYAIDRLVGEGGMGAVFAGTQIAVERRVAVKVLSPLVADDATIGARFHREAVLAASVARRGVPQIIDYDRDPEAGPFLVMELLEGESLADRVGRRERLPPREACAIAAAVLETLEAVHAKGIVHRDLKPANVFLAREPDGSSAVKVLDFGVARLLAKEGDMTAHGAVLGTPRYMAPEQAVGDPSVDRRADLFSVGAMLYACLGGKPPYAGLSGDDVLAAVRERPPEPLARVCPELPDGLCVVVDKATARLAADRYQDAAAMRRALAAVMEDLPEAPPASAIPASRAPTSAQATVTMPLGAPKPPEPRLSEPPEPKPPDLPAPKPPDAREDVAAVPSTRVMEPAPRRSRAPWAVAAAVIAVAAAVAVVRAVATRGSGPSPAATRGAEATAVGPAAPPIAPAPSASAAAFAGAPAPTASGRAPDDADAVVAGLAPQLERARALRRAGDAAGARAVLEKVLRDLQASDVRAPSPGSRLAGAVLITLGDIEEQQGPPKLPARPPAGPDDMGVESFRPAQDWAIRVTSRYSDVSKWAVLDLVVCASMRTGRVWERLLASARAAQARDLAALKDPSIRAAFPGGPDDVRARWAGTLSFVHGTAQSSYDAALTTARYADRPGVDPVDGKDCRAEAVALRDALDALPDGGN